MVLFLLCMGASAAGVGLAAALFVALGRATRGKDGFWPDVLGVFSRFFLSCSLAGFALVAVSTAWLATGEHHDVDVVKVAEEPGHDTPGACRFTWPSDTAAREQTSACPIFSDDEVPDSATSPARLTAARVPGTETVYLPDGAFNLFSEAVLMGTIPCAIAAVACISTNSNVNRRREAAQRRHLLASWQTGGPRPATATMPVPAPGITRDDLTWPQIAAASERPGVQGGPLEQAPFVSRPPGTPTPTVPEGYPLPYLRLMTRPAGAPHRSALLLFVEGGAWWVEADGQPPREGSALIERNPGSGRDLAAVIGEYTVDLGEQPVFLPQHTLDALRPVASRWVTTPPAPTNAPPPHTSARGGSR